MGLRIINSNKLQEIDPYLSTVIFYLRGQKNIYDESVFRKSVSIIGNTGINSNSSISGISFDGNTNNYVISENTADFALLDSSNNYTIEAIINPIQTNERAIFSTTPALVGKGAMLLLDNSSKLTFVSGGGSPIITSNFTIQTGIWQHISVSKNGSNYTFSKNGITQTISNSTSYTGNSSGTVGINLRRDSYSFPFYGLIAFLRISLFSRYSSDFTETYLF